MQSEEKTEVVLVILSHWCELEIIAAVFTEKV